MELLSQKINLTLKQNIKSIILLLLTFGVYFKTSASLEVMECDSNRLIELGNTIQSQRISELKILKELLIINSIQKSYKIGDNDSCDAYATAQLRALQAKLSLKGNYLSRLNTELSLNSCRESIYVQNRQSNDSILNSYDQMNLLIRENIRKVNEEIKALEVQIMTHEKDDICDSLNTYPDQLIHITRGCGPRVEGNPRLDTIAYKEGVFEEVIYENNRTIKTIIIGKEGITNVYKMVMYSWGGVYYFKNNEAIPKLKFNNETK